MRAAFSRFGLIICVLSFSILAGHGCSAAAESKTAAPVATAAVADNEPPTAESKPSRGATIAISPNGPADTVRAFYAHLREKRFRDAIFLTNLRPAIEGLTDTELKEYQMDFESIAKFVPAQIEINGEIVTGDDASVTAKLPNPELEKDEIQEIRLRKQGDVWVILTVDESAEKLIKKEGKNYFAALKIETHQDEAREMLDRLAKAQIAFSTLNKGLFGDFDALIASQFLPSDIKSSESTGYVYSLSLSNDRRSYSASAVPAVYGKTGKLSFAVKLDKKSQPHLTSKDEGAKRSK